MATDIIQEYFEYATADTISGLSSAPFIPFNPGDSVSLKAYVQFRVTTNGDFTTKDYRIRSFNAVADNLGKSSCGYGLGPYGLTPYGCGLDVAQGPPPPPPEPYSLFPTGTLTFGGQTSVQLPPPPPPPPPPNPGTGIWTVSGGQSANSTTPSDTAYFVLGINGVYYVNSNGSDALPSAQVVSLINGQIIAISISLQPGTFTDGTITARINKNGVSQLAIQATLNSPQTNAVATGSISVQVGDLLAIEVVSSGLTGFPVINGIAVAYVTT